MDSIQTVAIYALIAFIIMVAGYIIYYLVMRNTHAKYRIIYSMHHPRYRNGDGGPRCPAGCNSKKQCPYGNHCFNCGGGVVNSGKVPSVDGALRGGCCCYDFQCNECK